MPLRDLVPAPLRRLRHHPLVLRGEGRECTCCGGTFRRFAPQNRRPDARCPGCGALERHRTLSLYLRGRLASHGGALAVLHFAPEPAVARLFTERPGIEYASADLEPGAAAARVDITAIPYADASFDLVVVSHVLEHVEDDARALEELRRIVRPGGSVLLQHPIDYARRETREDPTVRSPEDRRAEFGQHDHVRLYGADFRGRVERAGFEVEMVRPAMSLEPELRARYGILDPEVSFRSDDIYVCTPG